VASAAMALAALWVYHSVQQAPWLSAQHGLLRQIVLLGLSVASAVLVYGVVAVVLRCSEIGELWTALRRKKGP